MTKPNLLTVPPQRLYSSAIKDATIDVNTKLMSASAIISTRSLDRDNEVVEPEALMFDWYRKNPVVFFGHQMIPFPVGTSESPEGELSLIKEADRVIATCYFSQVLPEAEMIFRLVEEKTIRATSIGFISLKAERLSDEDSQALGSAWPVYVHKQADLTEWSWVGVGSNRDAISRYLHDGHMGALRLTRSMTKALEPFRLPHVPIVHGADIGMFPSLNPQSTQPQNHGDSMTIPNVPATPQTPPSPLVSLLVLPPNPPSFQEAPKKAAKGKTKASDEDEDADADKGQKVPGGAVALQTLYSMVRACMAKADELIPMNEKPEVQEELQAFRSNCNEYLGTVAERARSTYPDIKFDMSELGDDDESDDEDEDDSEIDESDEDEDKDADDEDEDIEDEDDDEKDADDEDEDEDDEDDEKLAASILKATGKLKKLYGG